MAQPFDRGCQVPPPGEVDAELGEFWVGNPWFIPREHNLSAYERNRTFLNARGENFLDVSFVSGTDSDGDGRCAVAADLNNDGRMDLVIRQAGGGPLAVYENLFPQQHWLKVSLEGRPSNRQGIGARVVAQTQGRTIVRELFPANSYVSQAPALVHFGLGHDARVETLTIRWPSGHVQTVENVDADQHVLVTEGQSGVRAFGADP